MLEPWRTGKIIRIENETSSTRRFWIEIPELADFNFQPGQFVTLDLPIHEQKNKRWRSYSIASAPDGSNVIELVIVLLEGGAGTTYLFNETTLGSELVLRGPQGKFTLPETIDKDLFFVCTGTGIAPFRSMAHYINAHKIAHQNIHLIFGCRTFADGLYIDELKALEQKENNFFFHPVYSREAEVGDGMHKGYVHQVYEQLTQEARQPARFYLCGWKNMVDEAKQRIVALGYDRKDIHLELYG
ncbi:MAG: FAD-dependent oxidoreductase [Chitinophagaceae bacterium]|nr:FAD-dependent oxidoreductase [Chitinophagaceae bacterium]